MDPKEALGPDQSLYPVDPAALKETENEVIKDPQGVYKKETTEIRGSQPTIVKILQNFNLVGPRVNAEETKAVYEGVAIAYRVFKNQAKQKGIDLPIIPPEIEDTVMADYYSEINRTRDRTGSFPEELIFGHKLKSSQEALLESLQFMTKIKPRDPLTYIRYKGAVVTAFTFKTFQDVSLFNTQIKI